VSLTCRCPGRKQVVTVGPGSPLPSNLLLRRHSPDVARCGWVWPDVASSCTDSGWTWPGVARCLPLLAPRLAPRDLVSLANVRTIERRLEPPPGLRCASAGQQPRSTRPGYPVGRTSIRRRPGGQRQATAARAEVLRGYVPVVTCQRPLRPLPWLHAYRPFAAKANSPAAQRVARSARLLARR
jgi:hypothetical protein